MDGQPGLDHHRLTINMHLGIHAHQTSAGQRPVVRDIGGELKLQQAPDGESVVGHLLQASGPFMVEPTQSRLDFFKSFAVELDPRRLEAIEAVRLGRSLSIVVVLTAVAQTATGFRELTDRITYTIPQSTWVDVLSRMGYQRTMLIEIPLLDESDPSGAQVANARLEQAQRQLVLGEWRTAVGECRLGLDALSAALGDKSDVNKVAQQLFSEARSWDKNKRLQMVRRAVEVLLAPAHHDDPVAQKIEWTRTDAQVAVSILAALIRSVTQPPSIGGTEVAGVRFELTTKGL